MDSRFYLQSNYILTIHHLYLTFKVRTRRRRLISDNRTIDLPNLQKHKAIIKYIWLKIYASLRPRQLKDKTLNFLLPRKLSFSYRLLLSGVHQTTFCVYENSRLTKFIPSRHRKNIPHKQLVFFTQHFPQFQFRVRNDNMDRKNKARKYVPAKIIRSKDNKGKFIVITIDRPVYIT